MPSFVPTLKIAHCPGRGDGEKTMGIVDNPWTSSEIHWLIVINLFFGIYFGKKHAAQLAVNQ